MSNNLTKEYSMLRFLQEKASASKNGSHNSATDNVPEDLKDYDRHVPIVIELVKTAAESGSWSYTYDLSKSSDELIIKIAQEVKLVLSDVMVISKLGLKCIEISWHLTNEA